MGSGGVLTMITIIYEPKENRVTIDGDVYSCHSVHRLTQILQDRNYSTDKSYWLRGGEHGNNTGLDITGQTKPTVD